MNNDKTGEGIYRRATFSVSQVSFNGDEGVFYYRDKSAEKDEATGKYPKEALTKAGMPLDVVFLKIRRVLSAFKKAGGFSTNEHNSKTDTVMLFGKDNEVGVAADLREKYVELRTQQVVYCYLPLKKEVVRVIIKGSALGSDETAKGVLKFYDYLQSFASDEHSHEFMTRLQPVEEEGPKGMYHSLSFVRGDKLKTEQQDKVDMMIDDVHEKITAIDENFKERLGKSVNATKTDVSDEEVIEAGNGEVADDKIPYPEEGVNPEDIPF